MKRWRSAWFALACGAVIPAACSSTGVVGGKCRAGLRQCGETCIALATDSRNCGACGRMCPAGVACASGICGGPVAEGGPDADAAADGRSDGDADSNWRHDGGDGDAHASDGPTSDSKGGDGSGGDGSDGDGSTCTPPFDTPQHCGTCGTVCSGATSICSPSDGGYACVPLCNPPLRQCGTQCVDLNSDPGNCGSCDHACPSGLCQGGRCVGARFGHIVIACMNFEQTSRNAQPTVLLGNAVFLSLPQNDPVQILAYDQYAAHSAETNVDRTIGWAASARFRTFKITRTSTATDIPTYLSVLKYHVFLVYDQPNAPAGALGANGNSWRQTLDAFVRAGGTAIVLDGADGIGQMSAFMTNADLLSVTRETDVSGSELYNRAPTDAIGSNVLSPFLAYRLSCTLTTSAVPNSSTAFVVTDSPPDGGLGAPVVVHRTQSP